MIRRLFPTLAFAVSALLILAVAAFADPAKFQDQALSPSVQLRDTSGSAFCSGTVVWSRYDNDLKAETLVLTAKHCVQSVGQRLQVSQTEYTDEGDEVRTVLYPAKVWDISPTSDVAIVRLENQLYVWPTVAKIASGLKLPYGTPVDAVGYPLGRSLTVSHGTLGQIEIVPELGEVTKSARFRRANLVIAPGSSGGALFAEDASGDYVVIGTATAINQRMATMSFWTPTDELEAYWSLVKSWKLQAE